MKGTVPIVMCDDESGCDEWFIDNYTMGATPDHAPAGWEYNPRRDPDHALCPEHVTTGGDPE